MDALSKAIENRSSPLEVGSKTPHRGRVVSFRVSEKLIKLLEMQRASWGMSLSDTLRSILNFYFLPPLLLEAWESKVGELVEADERSFNVKRADLNAPTLAQRIEPVLVDSEEAEEYALFIHDLWEKSLKYFETLREEASTMNKIAEDRLLKTAEGFSRAMQKLKEVEVEP